MTTNPLAFVFPDANDLFHSAAKDFASRAIEAVNDKGIFSVVLSGGNTPKFFFVALTREAHYRKIIPWRQIQFFFGDERYVPADDAKSNYHLAHEYLFSKVPVNPENVYRIPTDFNDPNDAAKAYERLLREVFHIDDAAFPLFDLVYLGLGDDAHTASLMPSSDIVKQALDKLPHDKNNPLAAALFVPESKMHRITLTPNAINNSKNIIFLVDGINKATAVWEVLEGPPDPEHYPAQFIHCVHGQTLWYLDSLAASKLSSTKIQHIKSIP